MNVIRIATLPESRNMRDHEARGYFPHRRVIESPFLITARNRSSLPAEVRTFQAQDSQCSSLLQIWNEKSHAKKLTPKITRAMMPFFAGDEQIDLSSQLIAPHAPDGVLRHRADRYYIGAEAS